MLTRIEAVKMVNDHMDHGFKGEKQQWHYGRCELKQLLDALYGPPDPMNLDEHLKSGDH